MKDLFNMNVKKRNEWIYLGLILGVGFLLRIYAIDFGLPYLYHADEPIIVNHALAYGSGDLNPHFFNVPPLTSYLLFVIYGVLFMVGKVTFFFPSLDSYIKLYLTDPTIFYLLGRICVGVIPSVWTLLVWYHIIRKHFSFSSAVLSLIIFSTCFNHVTEAHYIYTDILLVLMICLVFGAIFDLVDKPTSKNLNFKVGVLIGLAISIKYNAVFLLIPYFFTYLSCATRKVKYFFIGIAGILLAYVIGNPFSIIDFKAFYTDLVLQAHAQEGTYVAHHFFYSISNGFGLVGTMTLLLSLALELSLSLKRSINIKKLAILSWLIVYYFVLIRMGQPYPRYILPLIPAVVFLIGDLLSFAKHRFNWSRKTILLVLILVCAQPFASSIQWNRIMSNEDTRTLAVRWMENNIPSGSKIGVYNKFFSPRLRFSAQQIDEKKKLTKHQNNFSALQLKRLEILKNISLNKMSFDLFFIELNLGASKERFLLDEPFLAVDQEDFSLQLNPLDYVVVPSFENDHGNNVKTLLKKGNLEQIVYSVSPYGEEHQSRRQDAYAVTGGPYHWKDLLWRERNGPQISIYRVKKDLFT